MEDLAHVCPNCGVAATTSPAQATAPYAQASSPPAQAPYQQGVGQPGSSGGAGFSNTTVTISIIAAAVAFMFGVVALTMPVMDIPTLRGLGSLLGADSSRNLFGQIWFFVELIDVVASGSVSPAALIGIPISLVAFLLVLASCVVALGGCYFAASRSPKKADVTIRISYLALIAGLLLNSVFILGANMIMKAEFVRSFGSYSTMSTDLFAPTVFCLIIIMLATGALVAQFVLSKYKG
jgi:hypothetical protein